MKRLAVIILANAVAAAPLPALADVQTFTGVGSNRVAACSNAKVRASNTLRSIRNATDISFGRCDCTQTDRSYEDMRWECTVDAYFEPQSR